MEVSYNLRYQKSGFGNKLLIDKEGEIIIYAKGFRLKGKGAGDKGELINFTDIKEFYFRNEKIIFITFAKEKYVLADPGTLFDQLLIDLYRSRNEFLMDALFMKSGKLRAEFEGDFVRNSKFGKLINKGSCKLKLYERSLVIVPEDQDAFAIYFDFVNFHEWDDMDYSLKLVLDSGVQVFVSKLGNDFEFFHEKMNSLLGGMYEVLVNETLKEIFPYHHVATLLKLGYKMKGGKAVSRNDISKMDSELAKSVDEFIFEDETIKEKLDDLSGLTDDYGVYYGIAKDSAVEGSFIKWVMFTIPSKNVVAFTILPRWKQGGASEDAGNKEQSMCDTYFYKVIMEKGNPADKVEDKVHEINKALVILRFAKDPCYKDKRELKHSPYQYAIRKMPFLRILRKSYVGKANAPELKDWKEQVEKIFERASLR